MLLMLFERKPDLSALHFCSFIEFDQLACNPAWKLLVFVGKRGQADHE